MSDTNEPRDGQPDEPATEQPEETAADQPSAAEEKANPTPRPSSPSAAAARRARRIGGRPAGAARQEGEPDKAPETDGTSEPGPAAKAKSIFTRKAKPIEPAEPATPAAAASVPAAATGGDDTQLGPPEPNTVVVTAVPAWLNWAPAAVLTAGAVAMAILLVVFSHGVWWGPDPKSVPADKSAPAVREQVLAAAKTCVATTNTYQYTNLEAFETKALACTTGQFTSQLRETIDKVIKVNAPRLKSSQTAQINRGGIEAITPDGKQWTILLFGQLSVTNNENKQPRTDPFAAEVRMNKVNGKWLMAGLTTVSSPLS